MSTVLDQEPIAKPPAPIKIIRDFGTCCACEKTGPDVRNFIDINKLAPIAGSGWGCFRCGLNADGAVAVLCDECFKNNVPPKFVCYDSPVTKQRMRVTLLHGVFRHDPTYHPECREVSEN
jgi:hypothetical protein